ncbi:MAG: class I SAM-dependent methyltransferase [Bacteroidota bacterium]
MDFFASAVDLSHQIILTSLSRGDVAVDATCGNGHDTVFLCDAVGEAGHVYAFDVQPEAIIETENRLVEAGVRQRATLIEAGHERMTDMLPSGVSPAAVMFNLGYRPGGSKSRITRSETTLVAIRSALKVLHPAGIVLLVVYTGHPGGREEARAVNRFVASLEPAEYVAVRWHTMNRSITSPYVVAIKKTS